MAFDVSKIQDSLNKYIVSPALVFGIAGFVFDVMEESSTRLKAEITDHYTEDNSYINDHMAIKPPTITIKGYVGELVYREESKLETFADKAVQKLTILNAALPSLSKAASQIKSAYDSGGGFSLGDITSSSMNDLRDIYALVKNLTPITGAQNQAYLYFKALQESRTIMSFQSPFEFMTDMVIEEVVANENRESNYISDFSITLKKVRFASVETTKFDPNKYGSRAASSAAKEFNTGPKSLPTNKAVTKSAPALLNQGMLKNNPNLWKSVGVEAISIEDLR